MCSQQLHTASTANWSASASASASHRQTCECMRTRQTRATSFKCAHQCELENTLRLFTLGTSTLCTVVHAHFFASMQYFCLSCAQCSVCMFAGCLHDCSCIRCIIQHCEVFALLTRPCNSRVFTDARFGKVWQRAKTLGCSQSLCMHSCSDKSTLKKRCASSHHALSAPLHRASELDVLSQ